MAKLLVPTALLLALAGLAQAQEKSVQQQIAEAVMPLPEDFRAGATVIAFGPPGEKTVLREGTNHMICVAVPLPGFFVRCFPKNQEALWYKAAELMPSNEDEFLKLLSAEVAKGTVSVPVGSVSYSIRGAELENALPLTVVFLPGATEESTGLTTRPSHYRPWLMDAGTPLAHIMIPGK